MISLGVGELIAACSIIIVAFFRRRGRRISADRTMGPALFGIDFSSQKEVYYLSAGWLADFVRPY